jgi:tetraacyldisaccharide 4'-kinase
MSSLERLVIDVMEGKKPGKPLLHVLSYLYLAGVRLRNFGYDANLFKSLSVSAPVVSVGNIVAGGTGKTPLVKFLAQELAQSYQVAILSRGYRSEIAKTNQVVRLKGAENARKFGDEPSWLARELPQVAVWVGKNRSLSAERAIQEGAQVLILDDGMQYRKLRRDTEIVVMDGEDLFGKGYFLPRGFLRDTPRRLKNADCVVINGAKDHQKVKNALLPYTEAPLVFVRMRLSVNIEKKRVGLFCAIGKPEKFMNSVRESGAEVVATFFKRDHDAFTLEELKTFAKRAKADLLVCTEKDEVKIPQSFKEELPIVACRGAWEVVAGHDDWQKVIESIKSRIHHV